MAWAGMLLIAQPEGVASILPASGVILGALLVSEKKQWGKLLTVVLVSNFLLNVLQGKPVWLTLLFSLAYILKALLFAWMLTRIFKSKITFDLATEALGLFGLTALFAATSLWGILLFDAQTFRVWFSWWAADALGVVLVTPVIVAWSSIQNEADPSYKSRLPELAFLAFVLSLFALFLYGSFTSAASPVLRNYMLFPILIWLAFRFNTWDMANALFLFSAIAVWLTLQETGIFSFAHQPRIQNLLSLQIYLWVAAFSGMLLSAMVNERKRAEHILKESRAQLNKAQLLAHLGHWSLNIHTNELEWSDEIYRILGLPVKSCPPSVQTFQAAVHPEDMDSFKAGIKKIPTLAEEMVVEHRIILPDQSIRHVEERIRREEDAFGRNPRILGTVQDITERKKMEAALRESEEKYRLVANFTYDWEAWFAPYGGYLYVSPACERITGYPAEEFIRSPDLMIKITHPEDRAAVIDHLQIGSAQARERDMSLDFRIITKKGEVRWLNHTCTAVYSGEGEWLGRRESNRDITTRKQSEAALRSRLQLGQFADNHSVDEVLEYTLNELEALTESQIGFFHSLAADQKTLTLQMWSTNTLRNLCAAEGKGAHYPIDQAGVWVDCVYQRQPVVYNDYASLPHRKGLPKGHAPVTRILVVPVMRNDFIVAILGVGNKLFDYDYQDIKMVSQLADLVWDLVLRKKSEEEARLAKEALEAANRDLQIALEREQKLSHTDSLTGINNRRYLFELAEREFDLAVRHQTSLSIIMFDLDYFKKVNDTFGHDIGDQVLQRVIETARAELRSSDVIGRYGGEEFVIILPLTTAQQAFPLAERIRADTQALRVPTDAVDARVTLSIGIVEFNHNSPEAKSVDDLIRYADEAMYAAKQAGRNRISIYAWE